MRQNQRFPVWMLGALFALLGHGSAADAASPTVAQALGLSPIQKGIQYDQPGAQQAAKCTIESERSPGNVSWVIRDEAGRMLRRYADTNDDNRVDTWCYFRQGVEVYRDVDADFNGKADQYRWLGTGGTRWATDKDEDGVVDAWKRISAEETTAEVVAALSNRDGARFRRLLLTEKELQTLGLGSEKQKTIGQLISKAGPAFDKLAGTQKTFNATSKWVHFAGTLPGVIPAGTDGSTRDTTVYENVVAVVETGGKHSQIHIGTLVRSGEAWRVIDRPSGLGGMQTANTDSGFFFRVSLGNRPAVPKTGAGASTDAARKVLDQIEQIDKSLREASTTAEKARLHARRADQLQQLAKNAATPEERASWIRQMADTVGAAVQSGDYPDGAKRLQSLYTALKSGSNGDLAACVKFRWLSASYGTQLQDPKADFAKVQEQWLKQLEAFVTEYPKKPDAAEAMLQLAIAQEFAGKSKEAKQWYARIVRDFPGITLAKKAAGAQRRLDSVGKSIRLQGQSLGGKAVDLASYRNKIVLIHYWATWCEPCKRDMTALSALQAKYGARGFAVIGVNLDTERPKAATYLQTNRLSWPHLYESGGLDGRLATEMGILTLPTMILVGQDGRVLHRSIHASQIEGELKKRLR